MSIAKMNKVTIIGIKDEQEEILKKIMKSGFLQIEDMSSLVDEEEYKGIFNKEEKSEEIAQINQKMIEIEKAISNIKKHKTYNDFVHFYNIIIYLLMSKVFT